MPVPDPPAGREWIALDPFAGGNATGAPAEPNALFRTLPVALPEPQSRFRVAFERPLDDGITVTVHLEASSATQRDVPVRVRTVALTNDELAASGGTIAIDVAAEPDRLYALAGYADDGTVAPGDIRVAVAGRTVRGVEAVDLPRLTSLGVPTFDDPVSQPATRGQARNRAYRSLVRRLAFASGAGADLEWSCAFILRALDRYGALREGARGSGAGPGGAAALHDALAAYHAGAERPEQAVDSPHESGDLDFVWSLLLGRDRGTVIEHVLRSMERLAPGGTAVCVFGFDAAADGTAGAPDCLARADIERLALDMISRGHDVAQLKFRVGNADRWPGAVIPYGMILRRT